MRHEREMAYAISWIPKRTVGCEARARLAQGSSVIALRLVVATHFVQPDAHQLPHHLHSVL